VEADDPARNRCGCFLPDLTRLATAPSADFRAGIWARASHSASVRRNEGFHSRFTSAIGTRPYLAPGSTMPLPFFLLFAAAAAGQPAVAASAPKPLPVVGRGSRRVFISPMGEPFVATAGADAITGWFQQADANHDGIITVDEMKADAERYFKALDLNHDGEIDPDEINKYEQDVAPQNRRSSNLLGLAEPVASADSNFNRGISVQEFTVAAGRRFNALDVEHNGKLTLAGLQSLRPPEPEREKDATAPQLNADADTSPN